MKQRKHRPIRVGISLALTIAASMNILVQHGIIARSSVYMFEARYHMTYGVYVYRSESPYLSTLILLHVEKYVHLQTQNSANIYLLGEEISGACHFFTLLAITTNDVIAMQDLTCHVIRLFITCHDSRKKPIHT